ncbi:uncharacterized protein LOC125164203 isoform X2 [Prionailurus viverrinus]|uniref:uncharacterized protein LOC125164203 isoform X2 n=1 Tax=Prionailurus viverrinus TaxID=61388 RepID=UPI001FF10EB6|nr:uncharacterized protein LOC125164203 isoform X2 [Prionailurus viverrinus]
MLLPPLSRPTGSCSSFGSASGRPFLPLRPRPSASFIHYEVVRWTSVSLLRNQAPTLAPDRWHQLATDHIPALPPTLQEIFSSSSLARNP